jgi:subtilisin family serine protease
MGRYQRLFRRLAALIASTVIMVTGLAASPVTVAAEPAPAAVDLASLPTGAAVPGAYIVRLRAGSSPAAEVTRLQAGALKGATVTARWSAALSGFAVRGVSATQAAALRADPAVAAVLADRVVRVAPVRGVGANAVQTDPVWGLDRIDKRCTARTTCAPWLDHRYTYTRTGAGIVVYVIDTGIRATHQEFRRTNGTSRVASHVNFTGDGINSDCNGHGTHVAGTIGGTKYGVAKGVTLRGVKVLDCDGNGQWSWVISGLNYVVSHHTTARAVANLSLGGGANSAVDDAVRAVITDGVTTVIASGNDHLNACNVTPARVTQAITVNATDWSDDLTYFSNGGSCTDLAAPGMQILSGWHTSDTGLNMINGTSMAAPHVAGCAARLLAAGNKTPAQVQTELKAKASTNVLTTPFGAISGTPNRLLHCPSSW